MCKNSKMKLISTQIHSKKAWKHRLGFKWNSESSSLHLEIEKYREFSVKKENILLSINVLFKLLANINKILIIKTKKF
jgi:hypothetical protein